MENMLNQCPKCGKQLNEKAYCDSCKVTYRSFRLAKEISNNLYNDGLHKSRIRDLSGAIESLNRSIKYNKRHVEARNLLGLVYFELGETVLALRQWVISQNIQSEENKATYYLQHIQKNQMNLERLNSAIKKYNQSLVYIQQKSDDLAIIHLKKVISLNPKFVKAYTLLALIYMKDQNTQQAKNLLLQVLAIDKTNYVARKYYEELFIEDTEDAVPVDPDKENERKTKVMKRQIAINQSVQQLLGVVFGLVIGAALVFFLIMPGRVNQLERDVETYKSQWTTSKEKLEERGLQIEEREARIQKLENDLQEAVSKNEQLLKNTEDIDPLMSSMTYYLQNDLDGAATALHQVDGQANNDEGFQQLYTQLSEAIFPAAAEAKYNAGYSAYNRKNYEEAVAYLETSLRYTREAYYSHRAVYYLGRSYQFLGRTDEAIAQFKDILENYPNSNTRGWAQNQLNILEGGN